jgi:CrcB protein
MNRFVLVLVGGGIGAVTRYGTTLLAGRILGPDFPWGTLLVNLGGCFLIGVALALGERSSLMPPHLRLFFVTGFLGGLTTFSSYAMETVVGARGSLSLAALNIALNNVAGLALVVLGARLATALV